MFAIAENPRAQTAASTFNGSRTISSAAGRSQPVMDTPLNDDNLFMPKVTIYRPDGASLLDIYESKKKDTWGKIIKAQYLDDEVMFSCKYLQFNAKRLCLLLFNTRNVNCRRRKSVNGTTMNSVNY